MMEGGTHVPEGLQETGRGGGANFDEAGSSKGEMEPQACAPPHGTPGMRTTTWKDLVG